MKNVLLLFLLCCMPLFSTAQSSPEGNCDKVLKLVTHLPTPASCKSIASRKRKEACLVEELEAYIHASLTFPKSFRTRVKSLRKTSCPLEVVIGTDGKVWDVKPLEGSPSFMANGVKVALKDMPAMEPGKLNGTARCVGVDVAVRPNRAAFSDKVMDDFSRTMGADELVPPKDDGPKEIFKVVEEMPRYFSADCEEKPKHQRKECASEAMLERIYDKMVYPQQALDQNEEGVAVVQFVVLPDGQVTSINLVRDPGFGMGAEAERLVREYLTGGWVPGKQRGRPVAVQFNLPVKFEQ